MMFHISRTRRPRWVVPDFVLSTTNRLGTRLPSRTCYRAIANQAPGKCLYVIPPTTQLTGSSFMAARTAPFNTPEPRIPSLPMPCLPYLLLPPRVQVHRLPVRARRRGCPRSTAAQQHARHRRKSAQPTAGCICRARREVGAATRALRRCWARRHARRTSVRASGEAVGLATRAFHRCWARRRARRLSTGRAPRRREGEERGGRGRQ